MVLNREYALKHRVFIEKKDHGLIAVHCSDDPLEIMTLCNMLRLETGKPVTVRQVSKTDFLGAVRSIYNDLTLELSEADEKIDNDSMVDIYHDSAPIINLLNHIIASAIEQNSTDIHLETTEHHADIRFRVGLFLVPFSRIGKTVFEQLSVRIKYLARLNINERRVPQDGKASLLFNNQNLEIRVSIIPTKSGESIVLRLLRIDTGRAGLEHLGFDQKSIAVIKEISTRKSGMLLCAGPTGSGKTTTLHGIIRNLNDGEKKIITIEDPVEYVLEGINQIQVNDEIGLTFSKLLKKILRHDPDIIMVGEIRDPETARLAFSASLTGHLVLSTVHTNDAVTTFRRVRDLEIDSFLIESSLRLIISQRLIRKNCPHCVEKTPVPPEVKRKWTVPFDYYMKGAGCDSCKGTGYSGLTIVYELLEVDERIKELLNARKEDQIAGYLAETGFRSLLQCGLEKVAAGDISLADLVKVID